LLTHARKHCANASMLLLLELRSFAMRVVEHGNDTRTRQARRERAGKRVRAGPGQQDDLGLQRCRYRYRCGVQGKAPAEHGTRVLVFFGSAQRDVDERKRVEG
jgi:hypothetical protein